MDLTQAFELKHLHGIPYYVQNSTLFTFELSREEPGKPSEHCIAIGSYDASSDSITYYADWRDRVQPHLDAFRRELQSVERNTIRQTVVKPQKSRKATRNPRKSSTRAKAPKNK
jgi:hypothetical protein